MPPVRLTDVELNASASVMAITKCLNSGADCALRLHVYEALHRWLAASWATLSDRQHIRWLGNEGA